MCWRVALRRDVTCPDLGSNVRGFYYDEVCKQRKEVPGI